MSRGRLNTVVTLSLFHTRLGDSETVAAPIAELIAQGQGLKNLHLQDCSLGNRFLRRLAQGLRGTPLSAWGGPDDEDDDEDDVVAETRREMSASEKREGSLETLDLRMNANIGDSGAQALAAALVRHPRDGDSPKSQSRPASQLRTLNLSDCSIGDEGACALADAVEIGAHRLFTVKLDRNRITDTGAEALRHACSQRVLDHDRLADTRGQAFDLFRAQGQGENQFENLQNKKQFAATTGSIGLKAAIERANRRYMPSESEIPSVESLESQGKSKPASKAMDLESQAPALITIDLEGCPVSDALAAEEAHRSFVTGKTGPMSCLLPSEASPAKIKPLLTVSAPPLIRFHRPLPLAMHYRFPCCPVYTWPQACSPLTLLLIYPLQEGFATASWSWEIARGFDSNPATPTSDSGTDDPAVMTLQSSAVPLAPGDERELREDA